VRQRYELPAFRTLRDEAQRARAAINREFFDRVCRALGEDRCLMIDRLLEVDGVDKKSLWHSLKLDPGAPTLKQVRVWVKRAHENDSPNFLHIDRISAQSRSSRRLKGPVTN
jgi:hypothetical protein